jgi:hypothetical protein
MVSHSSPRRKIGFQVTVLAVISLMALSISSLPEADAAASDRAWTSQTVDNVHYGHDLVMAVDSLGFSHMLYCDYPNGDLYYTHMTAEGWLTVYLCHNGLYDPSSRVATNAIAVDSSNKVHLVFSDSNGELYHISDASDPSTKVSLGTYGAAPSLAAGADGSMHLSYVNANGYLCYRSYNGGWSPAVTVDETMSMVVTTGTSIAVSPSGVIHIAYVDGMFGELRYAFKQGTSWNCYTLDMTAGIEELDLALDSMGNPHLAYRVSGSDDLNYCHYLGGSWTYTTIDSASNVKGSVSIALGDDDVVYIAYDHSDYQNSRVMFATNEGGVWTTSIVDDSTVAINGASIAVLPDGSVSICALNDADSVMYFNGTLLNAAPSITTTPSTGGRESVAYSYAPSADKAVSWSVRTNAPFLTWSGTAVTGTPGLDASGTYWVNVTATVAASGLYDFQNYTLTIGDAWSPTLENQPGNGQETVGYAFEPQYNETATVTVHSTNAPFLSWNGTAFVGTPGTSDAGTYWINITATSGSGLLSSYQNMTIAIGDSWAPLITSEAATQGRETIEYSYTPRSNESVVWSCDTDAGFLSWNGTAVMGTPGTEDAGEYYVNLTAVSVDGKLSSYQNFTLVIGDSWMPSFTNTPASGQETVEYTFAPAFNETVEINSHRTNAPFLTWNGAAFTGTPSTSDAGTYWVNITAVSSEGLLTSYQNSTFTIGDSWAPVFVDDPVLQGRETRPYHYQVGRNESSSLVLLTTHDELFWLIDGVLHASPGPGDAGTYSISLASTSTLGLLTSYQNFTVNIGGSWAPSYTNAPAGGQETLPYSYAPALNETVAIVAHSTNAPFLSWNGTAFVGTPGQMDAGTYWINITADSTNGLLGAYQNSTFTIGDSWAPTIVSVPPERELFATLYFEYAIEVNDTAVLELHTNAPFLSLSNGKISGTMVAGTYYVNVSARSVAGLLVSWQNFTLTVVEDHDAPTVAITSPRDGTTHAAPLTISWTATDDGSGITGKWYKADGEEWVQSNSFSVALELGEGPHIITVRAVDAVGNEATASVLIYIDAIAPTVISTSPTGEDVPIAQPVVIVFSEPMDATTVTVTVNGAPVTLTWDGETATIDGNWEDGTAYTVEVVGFDLFGNALQPYTWSFETEVRLVTVSGSLVGDDGAPVAFALLFVNGVEVAVTDANGSYSFQLPPGEHSITASRDGYENMTVGVTVGSEPVALNMELHNMDDRSPHWWFWAILLFLAPCLVVYTIYRDRKG